MVEDKWFDGKNTCVDQGLVLCLTEGGPYYVGREATMARADMRRVRNVYYDRGFANLFLRQLLNTCGKLKTTRNNLVQWFVQHGHPAALLLPRADGSSNETWIGMLEDVMCSPMVKQLRMDNVAECLQHREWFHLSIDATIKVAMKVKGQANYRMSKEARDTYVVKDGEAKRRVVTVRGRTGGVLVVKPIVSEAAEHLGTALTSMVSEEVRQQVRYVAFDNPSGHLWTTLQGSTFPNLEAIYLDPVHLAIVYQTAFWGENDTRAEMDQGDTEEAQPGRLGQASWPLGGPV